LARAGAGLFGIVVILVRMWGLKEKASELVQRVKDYDKPRLFFFLFIFLILDLFIIFIHSYSYPFQIDDESAMYFLSALVQSQAAILAIVITLTLIAVQIASAHYSPRVIDIFKKDFAIWWFLCYYGFSIFFGLCILMMMQVIQNENPDILAVSNCYSYHISLEDWIYAAYWIAISSFVVLFLYIKKVLDLLNPSKIIKELSENITKENVLKHIESVKENKKDRTKPIEEDPIQPIMDIIHSSVMKYDIATTRVGLGSVTDRVIEIIDLDDEEEKEISRHVCDHFVRVCRLTVSKMDEESTGEVIRNLSTFGKLTVEKGLGYATSQVAWSLKDVGELTAEREFEDATWQVAKSLGVVGKAAAKRAEQWFEGATIEVIISLEDVGEIAAKKRLGYATQQVARSLRDVGTSAAEKGSDFENVATRVAVSLGTVGRITAKKELENAISQVVESLGSVGVSAAKNRLNDTMWYVASSLGDVGISAAEKGNEFEQIVTHVARRLQRVYPQGYKNENVLLRVVSSLGDVGVSAAENRLNDATSEVVRSLVGVGQSAAEEGKGFEHVVQCAVVSLVGVGTAIEKEELKHTTVEAVQSLAKSTISSEKIVKTTIRELKQEEPDRSLFQKHMELYERPIRQDRDSFQKFINLYEQ
jgi:hypothetical protein